MTPLFTTLRFAVATLVLSLFTFGGAYLGVKEFAFDIHLDFSSPWAINFFRVAAAVAGAAAGLGAGSLVVIVADSLSTTSRKEPITPPRPKNAAESLRDLYVTAALSDADDERD